MTQPATNIYKRHRFPPAIIQYAVWLYHRFNLSHRDIEDLLAERRIEVSYESVRLWCNKFDSLFSKRLKRRHPGFSDTFFMDEVFVTIAGRRHYLWRATGRPPGTDASDDPRHRSLREQPGGALPPADPGSGARHAPLQFVRAGAAIPERPRGRVQPVQPAAAAGVGDVLPVPSDACV